MENLFIHYARTICKVALVSVCGLLLLSSCVKGDDLDDLNKRIDALENPKTPELLSTIQSIIVVPTHTDGSIGISSTKSEIQFEVLPLSVAETIASLDVSNFSLEPVPFSEGNIKAENLPVLSVQYKDKKIVIETSGESLSNSFFSGLEDVSYRLKISDGESNVSSSYFNIAPDNTSEGFFFRLQDLSGEQYEPFMVENNVIHVYIPHGVNLSALYPLFTGKDVFMSSYGFEITGKQAFDFSDFTKPFNFKKISSDGTEESKWEVNIYDLPVLFFDTPDGLPITSKTERTKGCMMRLLDEAGEFVDLGTAGIRGRGNSTWQQPKKPYNIKLDKKHEILGLQSSKHWILLANAYFDRTQLHNATAFEMARLTDYPWVQSGRFVELFVNGQHKGLYYLCEKIRIEKGKIDITEIGPTDLSGEALTGGYLLESAVIEYPDICLFSDYFNKTGRKFAYKLGWELKHPEDDIPQEQFDYIKNSLNQMEQLIFDEESLAKGTYRDYFDIESAINWWMVEEATLNEEATRSKNINLYKDRNDKFRMGPPWDFDAYSFGLYGTSHFYCTKTALYFENLFKDPVFVERLKEKWAVQKDIWLDKIPQFIDTTFELIHKSALRNDKMWPDFCPETRADEKTYEQNVQDMKAALIEQIQWMDSSIKSNYFTDWWDENDWPPSHR